MFYIGRFEGSFARGVPFQENPDTGDARVSGTLASLAGLEEALQSGNEQLIDLATQRILMIHSIIMSIGGIVSGFLAGYLTKFLAEKIKLPANLEGLKPVLILPFLSTIIVGLMMIFVIAPPVQGLNNAMNAWLNGMRGANAALLLQRELVPPS